MSASQAPLRIPLKSDRLRIGAAVVVFLLALLAIAHSGLSGWQQTVLMLLIVIASVLQYRRWQQTAHWCQLQCLPAGQWSLHDAQGRELLLALHGTHLVSPWLIIVCADVAGRTRHLWFWKHHHSAENFRKLSIYIKLFQYDTIDS